ncbi:MULTISPECIES: DUF6900 domain-containing protein [Burkholderia cepacia complex]|uniref:DUF6900 domain-containing protein n=1 Tax=Burkholderia cepacia complex TaxID=87882 RepID=UPI00190428EE|nr:MULTISPECIES: hypothetical protein [Burkholderia cepacia complex]MBK1824336.1 hypothetical protein [Burkholderia orbicola]MDR8032222.1 hypothetical protein [Burkholderia cenocepacia]
MTKKQFEALITAIAHKHLGIATLKTHRSDRLDFHDCAVWYIRSALIAAFDAGVVHGRGAAAR